MRGPAVRPIVIAAGGTGGHFFPAEALASELTARGHRVALMTDVRAAARLPDSWTGREVFVLAGAGIAGRGLRGVLAMGRLAAGMVQARAILRRLNPAAIVGFGGYPTVAPVIAAATLRRAPPVILHEQNAVLGRANRLLARRATALALSFAATTRIPAGVATAVTGNPVRPHFVTPRPERAPPATPPALLVLGGSLGARVFSDTVPAAVASLPVRPAVTQQCRPEDLDRVRAAYAAAGIDAELASFFDAMPARLAAATLVIARAGASTVAELSVMGCPSILVPLPGAIDDHQTANARALADAGAAWLVPQTEIETLPAKLAALLADPAALARAGQAALRQARPDAAARLADLVEQHAAMPVQGPSA